MEIPRKRIDLTERSVQDGRWSHNPILGAALQEGLTDATSLALDCDGGIIVFVKDLPMQRE